MTATKSPSEIVPAPTWRCLRMTAVGKANVIFDPGAVLHGARPLRKDGRPCLDFEPINAAADAIANPPGGARLLKDPDQTGIPPAPFPGMTLVGVKNRQPIYEWTRGERREDEAEAPLFKYIGSRGCRIAGLVREIGQEFSATFIEDSVRHLVVPLNDLARDVLTRQFHPNPAA
jgi:hypothetical protein